MYFYKLKTETRTRYMTDNQVKGDPYKFFAINSDNLEHWCHITDEEHTIDMVWPETLKDCLDKND